MVCRGVTGNNNGVGVLLYNHYYTQELSKLSSALAGKDNSRLNDLGMMTGEKQFRVKDLLYYYQYLHRISPHRSIGKSQ